MAYSNDLEQIRAGLTNYVGAAAQAAPFEGKAKNQIVVSLLVDELLAASQLEKGAPCDSYVLVPLFKGINIYLKQQIILLSKDPTEENKQRVLNYDAMIRIFEELIKENTPKTGGD